MFAFILFNLGQCYAHYYGQNNLVTQDLIYLHPDLGYTECPLFVTRFS